MIIVLVFQKSVLMHTFRCPSCKEDPALDWLAFISGYPRVGLSRKLPIQLTKVLPEVRFDDYFHRFNNLKNGAVVANIYVQ